VLGGVAVSLGALTGVLRGIRAATERAQEAVGRMSAALERALSAIRTVKASRAEARETAHVGGAALDSYRSGLRVARLRALVGPAGQLAVQGSLVLVLAVGGARVASGDMSVGDLVAFLLYLFFLLLPLGTILSSVTELQTALAASTRLREVEPDAAVPAAVAAPLAAPASLEFDAVSFAYPDGREALHDVSFTAPRHAMTGIVGPSGAGKTTILSLIERFHEPSSGRIRLDGLDLAGLPREAVRRRIGYVEQEAPVLAGTIRENLSYAAPEAGEADLAEAVRVAGLEGLIARLPEGLDTVVGDHGVTLSGGERQRIAIARALLPRPAILLMDEATSQLDSRTEAALRATMARVARTRTVIVVAHRLSTVVAADRLVVLEAGRVRATGTHEELVEADALYRELASGQLLAPRAA
jgi:ABC-type multidrug transport system fused ATPase/permease subunit